MKFKMVAFTTLSLMLTGCSIKHYTQKPILYGSDSIPVTSVSPSSCKYIGDVEGSDGITIDASTAAFYDGTKDEVRQGALNSLRNNAFDVASKLAKPTIYITSEEANCIGFGVRSCDPKTIIGSTKVHKYIRFLSAGTRLNRL